MKDTKAVYFTRSLGQTMTVSLAAFSANQRAITLFVTTKMNAGTSDWSTFEV